ncbi:hypothetical protein [Bergeriella denitrificans]|uniref:Uncharacterized protein n=1 Tax=Bergeriella denitrificans TaxID=494 RepID=A0A378UIF8_BERDE|nr:hypothetical protein [Bergeriella denitrificans]STZ76281.1 Uncharacterised protein [Bergeriella denitrificans]
MEQEKIYYAVIILLCAASMLLSPFFYIRRTQRRRPERPKSWKTIAVANLIMLAALAWVWWKWL